MMMISGAPARLWAVTRTQVTMMGSEVLELRSRVSSSVSEAEADGLLLMNFCCDSGGCVFQL
jgi:hypothetical protein